MSTLSISLNVHVWYDKGPQGGIYSQTLQRKLARSVLQGRLDLTGGTTLVLETEEEGQRNSSCVMDVHRWQSSTGAQPCMENDHTALPACLLPPTPASLSQGSDSLY